MPNQSHGHGRLNPSAGHQHNIRGLLAHQPYQTGSGFHVTMSRIPREGEGGAELASCQNPRTNCRNIHIPVLDDFVDNHRSLTHSLRKSASDTGFDRRQKQQQQQRKMRCVTRRNKTSDGFIGVPGSARDGHLAVGDRGDFAVPGSVVDEESTCLSNQHRTQTRNVEQSAHFRFLDLPVELRLKVYGYLVPSRAHKIATQHPYSGSYYQTPPLNTTQSLYPSLLSTPNRKNLTTYFLLNTPYHRRPDGENPIKTAILSTCRQIWREAEAVLYEGCRLDFGEYIEAVMPFMKDRSESGRRSIRNVQLDIAVPSLCTRGFGSCRIERERKEMFEQMIDCLRSECTGLKEVGVRILSKGRGSLGGEGESVLVTAGGEVESLVSSVDVLVGHEISLRSGSEGLSLEEREWEAVRELVRLPGLQGSMVSWLGFGKGSVEAEARFEGWLERRMGFYPV